MASVYLARDDQGRDAAVKVLDPERVLEEDVRRFAREYELVAPLNHPHIVRVYETGDWNGFAWMALEYVDGSDLEQLLLRWQTQPPADRFAIAATLTTQIASALAHVHDQGLIHRDLKPANVFLTSDGMAKLGDFGVVKSEDNQSQDGRTGSTETKPYGKERNRQRRPARTRTRTRTGREKKRQTDET